MYVDNNSKLIACKPSKLKKNFKKSVIAEEKNPTVLTGKDCGEEDVVGKRNESTFSKRIKYAVLICKLLSLLGQFLFIHPTRTPKRENKAID